MADRPSIKGSVIAGAVEDLKALYAAGKLTPERLTTAIGPQFLELFEAPLNPTQWYDIDFYRRCIELLREIDGGGKDDYVRERGFRRGKALMEAGLYQQMEYAGRASFMLKSDPVERFAAYGRDLRLIVTLSKSLCNFMDWRVVVDSEAERRYRIEVGGAADYPDIVGLATEGMIDAMSSGHGQAGLWRFERLSPDLVVYRMTRSL